MTEGPAVRDRLHAVISTSASALGVNIRTYVVRATGLDDLVDLGTVTRQAASFLGAAVRAGLNVIVSGATQAKA